MLQELIDAITDMREEDALKIAQSSLDSGASSLEVLDACRQAMEVIGQRFEVRGMFHSRIDAGRRGAFADIRDCQTSFARGH